jgi:hypothetical protein
VNRPPAHASTWSRKNPNAVYAVISDTSIAISAATACGSRHAPHKTSISRKTNKKRRLKPFNHSQTISRVERLQSSFLLVLAFPRTVRVSVKLKTVRSNLEKSSHHPPLDDALILLTYGVASSKSRSFTGI